MRVVIAEERALLREGLRRLFEDAGHEVTDAVADADRLRAAVSEHRPDLAVVDIRMPPTFTDEGIRAADVDPRRPSRGGSAGPLTAHRVGRGRAGLVTRGG